MKPPQPPTFPGRPGSAPSPSAFRCLVQLCLAELRADVDRLLDSNWSGAERHRAFRLARALEQACERDGDARMMLVTCSMATLVSLDREAAVPLVPTLRKKFRELFLLAERRLLERRQTG